MQSKLRTRAAIDEKVSGDMATVLTRIAEPMPDMEWLENLDVDWHALHARGRAEEERAQCR